MRARIRLGAVAVAMGMAAPALGWGNEGHSNERQVAVDRHVLELVRVLAGLERTRQLAGRRIEQIGGSIALPPQKDDRARTADICTSPNQSSEGPCP
jgi:hypothetical protein